MTDSNPNPFAQFDDYQAQAQATNLYWQALEGMDEQQLRRLCFRLLLLAELTSEVGEVAGELKKWVRDKKTLRTDGFMAEVGDALWGLATFAQSFGFQFSHVALKNIQKLADRQKRGTLEGDGDDR